MKAVTRGVLVLVLVLGFVSFSTAEEKQGGIEKGMAHGDMMDKEMKADEQKMGHGKMMMCPMMMGRAMVATSDGGVIVLVGNKLQKYDKNLALKQEVEIAIDMEDMKKKMGKCPMRDKMMKDHTAGHTQAQAKE